VAVLILRLKGAVCAGTTKEIVDNLDLAKWQRPGGVYSTRRILALITVVRYIPVYRDKEGLGSRVTLVKICLSLPSRALFKLHEVY
jgi:hypothetical protein